MSLSFHLIDIENVDCRLACAFCGNHQRNSGHHNGELRYQNAVSFDAAIDANTPASCGLRLADGGVEKFRDVDAIEHFHFVFPRLKARKHSSTTAATIGDNYFAISACNRTCEIHQKFTIAEAAA
jgi:hypothetical protein